MLRGLIHFWRLHLAVALGAAVTGTVLTGSLLVGDSLHQSLRALLLDRLGAIDLAVVAPRPFREELAAEVGRALAEGGSPAAVVPILQARGSAARAASPDSLAAGVTVLGADERFFALYPPSAIEPQRASGGRFPPLAINETLASALGAAPGDDVLLSCEAPSDIPREALMGHKDPEKVIATRRFTLARVLPDRGPGGFGLAFGQAAPPNAFVPLQDLQRMLETEGLANTLLVAPAGKHRPPGGAAVAAALQKSLDLADIGLTLRPIQGAGAGGLVLDSRDFFLPPAVVTAAEAAAAELRAPIERVFSYLATGLRAHDRLVPYSMVAAIDPLPVLPGAGDLRRVDGAPVTPLREDEILLTSWAAEDLAAGTGDTVEMSYLLSGAGSAGPRLRTASKVFRVGGVVAQEGLAADRSLTPAIPGIDEASDMASWSAPFEVDFRLVRPRDEAYWHRYGPSPKAFLPLATGRRLWGNRFGDLTSMRVVLPPTAAGGADRFRRGVLARLPLASLGLEPRAVRAEGLRAADAGTDFTSLFLGFSSFLILAAALLTGLLFSLGIARRSREIGLLLALGFPLRAVRRRFLGEGAVLAAAGALLGLGGAVAYGALQVHGLNVWWRPAVGAAHLRVSVEPATLLGGFLATVAVVLVSIVLAVRRAGRRPAAHLLAGDAGPSRGAAGRRASRGLRVLFYGAAAAALLQGGAAASGRLSGEALQALAFGLGACLLVAGLCGFALASRAFGGRELERGNLLSLAVRNCASQPGRGVLCIGLVATACFVLVLVAASQRQGAERDADWAGFSLIAESQVPLYQDLGSPKGRAALGVPAEAEALLAGTGIVGLSEVPGDDASCLNLYLPRRPRLLGVPPSLARRAGFRFTAALAESPRPLPLLERDAGSRVLPAVGDEQAVRWILHLGLGDELAIGGGDGGGDGGGQGSPRLRIVGMLAGSPLQGALLISEANLLRAFPDRGGRSVFLIQAPPGREGDVARVLRSSLRPFGFRVTPVAERLALFREVENTYLAIFQALGGLGLILGTLGLGVELMRGAVERRWELASLRAFGFRRRRLSALLLLEHMALLGYGVALGTVAGLLAAQIGRSGQGPFPWSALAATLGGIFLAGLAASILAIGSTLRAPLVPVLKAER